MIYPVGKHWERLVDRKALREEPDSVRLGLSEDNMSGIRSCATSRPIVSGNLKEASRTTSLLTSSSHSLRSMPWQQYAIKFCQSQQLRQPTPKFGNEYLYNVVGELALGNQGPSNVQAEELDSVRKTIADVATRPREGFENGWLQPTPTAFILVPLIKLMQITARNGFASRYPHYRWGEAFHNGLQPQKYGLSRLYELVVNTNPSYAFLWDDNPAYAQGVVMAHVLGHTDFFAQNYFFQQTNRKMHQYMGDTKRAVQKLLVDPYFEPQTREHSGLHPVTQFIEKYHTLQWLIDMTALKPPELETVSTIGKMRANVVTQDDLELDKRLGVHPSLSNVIVPREKLDKALQAINEEEQLKVNRVPYHPTRDVLGFIIEHSTRLDDWQRDLLYRLREESYYFSPQVQTKVMNEGWASFWHNRLTEDAEIMNHPVMRGKSEDISLMIAGVEAPSSQSMNPYWLGVNMFRHIYNRAARGLPAHSSDAELLNEYGREELLKRKDMKQDELDDIGGIKKIQHVMRHFDDVSFLDSFITEDVIRDLNLYVYDYMQGYDPQTGQPAKQAVIISKDPTRVKEHVLRQYINGGLPIIEVLDGNLDNTGELLLNHVNVNGDLNRADAIKTIKTLYELWGKPVSINCTYTLDVDQEKLEPIIQQLYYARAYGSDPETIEKLEQEYFEVKDGARVIPLRITTEDGKSVELWELDEDGELTGDYFDASYYH